MKNMFAFTLALTLFSALEPSADACFSCGNWTDLEELEDLCDPPSAPLWSDVMDCTAYRCGTPCAGYLASYSACVASGIASCAPVSSGDCDDCRAGQRAFEGVGCGEELGICSADQTGCVTCSQWLAGGNEHNVCQDAYAPGFEVSDCACAATGPCATACVGACGPGYLEPGDASFLCAACVGDLCGDALHACLGS